MQKLTQKDTASKVQKDRTYKIQFLVPSPNYIEFIVPDEHSLNRMLGHNKPIVKVDVEGRHSLSGNLGKLRYYYIPPKNYEEVMSLLTEFKIPEEMHKDIIWAYLNMVFAACDAAYTTNFRSDFEKAGEEYIEAFQLLQNLSTGKISLDRVVIEYSEKSVTRKTLQKRKSFKDKIAIGIIEEVLSNYMALSELSMHQSMAEMFSSNDGFGAFFGHKNAEKQWQSYYSSVLFDYLRQHLFRELFHLLGDKEQYSKEAKKLRKLFPRNRIYLFIGKLMKASALLKFKNEPLDEDIIDNIKKKLSGKIRSENQRREQITKSNQQEINGVVELTPFHLLF
jgi:hypothetical protein